MNTGQFTSERARENQRKGAEVRKQNSEKKKALQKLLLSELEKNDAQGVSRAERIVAACLKALEEKPNIQDLERLMRMCESVSAHGAFSIAKGLQDILDKIE